MTKKLNNSLYTLIGPIDFMTSSDCLFHFRKQITSWKRFAYRPYIAPNKRFQVLTLRMMLIQFSGWDTRHLFSMVQTGHIHSPDRVHILWNNEIGPFLRYFEHSLLVWLLSGLVLQVICQVCIININQ